MISRLCRSEEENNEEIEISEYWGDENRIQKVCYKNERFYIVAPFVLSYHYFGAMTEASASRTSARESCIFHHAVLIGGVCLISQV